MDLDLLNNLKDAEKERYMQLMRVFDQDGWKIINDWAVKNAEDAKERAASAQTWELNRIYAGQRIVYDIIASLPELNEQEYTALAQQNVEEKEEEAQLLEADYE